MTYKDAIRWLVKGQTINGRRKVSERKNRSSAWFIVFNWNMNWNAIFMVREKFLS